MNVVKEISRINALELDRGMCNTPASWHAQYASSPWVFVGNLPDVLTEGDVVCIFSQWGEIDDLHLVRDGPTGSSRGFGFVKYGDARSCVLAVDNFCGLEVLGRTARVDHVLEYKLPREVRDRIEKEEEEGGGCVAAATGARGHAYRGKELEGEFDLDRGVDLFAPPPAEGVEVGGSGDERRRTKKKKKEKKEKKDKKGKKERKEKDRRKDAGRHDGMSSGGEGSDREDRRRRRRHRSETKRAHHREDRHKRSRGDGGGPDADDGRRAGRHSRRSRSEDDG